eukprot:s9434_g1.t1
MRSFLLSSREIYKLLIQYLFNKYDQSWSVGDRQSRRRSRTCSRLGRFAKSRSLTAKRLEAEGKLRLVPSKGLITIKPPSEKGGRYKRKYRMALCGNFVDPAEAQGSLYAGGISAETLRALLASTACLGWRGATTDITTAFLQALWPEHMPMYAVMPPRLLCDLEYADESEAWLVLRPLYGLRESPAIWSAHRNERLRTLRIPYNGGFVTLKQSTSDAELWFAINDSGEEEGRGTLVALLVTYVDDLFYIGPERLVLEMHNWVSAEWPCSGLQWASDPGGVRYLGMEIFQRESGEYEVTQSGYIMDLDLLRSHDLLHAPQTLLPCPKEWVTDDVDQEPEDFTEPDLRFGQRLIGEQLWLAMRTRPDIHHVVSYMSMWVSKHPRRISKIALRVLSYLHKTVQMKMILGQPVGSNSSSAHQDTPASSSASNNKVVGFQDLKIVGFSDASFAPYGGGRSYGASLVTVEDSPVAWRCGRQSFTMLSIMESELYQATEAAVLIENVGALLDELANKRIHRLLKVDNASAVSMLGGGPGSWRTRHLKVRSAYLLERIQEKWLDVEHVEGTFQRADLSTKMHSKIRLWALLKMWRNQLMVIVVSTYVCTEPYDYYAYFEDCLVKEECGTLIILDVLLKPFDAWKLCEGNT